MYPLSICFLINYYQWTSVIVMLLKVPVSGSRKQHYTGNPRNQLFSSCVLNAWSHQRMTETQGSTLVFRCSSGLYRYVFMCSLSFRLFLLPHLSCFSEKSSDRNILLLCLFVNNSNVLVRLASPATFRSYWVINVQKNMVMTMVIHSVTTLSTLFNFF